MTTSHIELAGLAGGRRDASDVLAEVRDWSRVFVATLARGLVVTLLGMALWAAAPAVIGWHPTTVMTGSMEPRLAPGDVVVSRPVAPTSLHQGQVLLFDDPDHPGDLRVHRFVKPGADGAIITKGDANPQADSTPIERSAVHGVAFIRVPSIGAPIVWLRDGQWHRALLLALALAVLALLTTIDGSLRRMVDSDSDSDSDSEPDDGADGPTTGLEGRRATDTSLPSAVVATTTRRALLRRARRVRRLRRAGSALLVLLVVAGAGSMLPGRATAAPFGATAANRASSLSAASTFDCLGRTVTNAPFLTYEYSAASGASESDLSGNGHTGTLTGGASRVGGTCTTSPYVTLDGSSGQVTQASSTKTTAPTTFTVESWIRTSTAAGKVIGFGNVQTGSSSAYDRQLYVNSAGKVAFGVYNSGNITLVSTTTVTDGRWHHVVGTMSSAGMVLFVDGASQATNTNTAAEPNSGWWRVGYDNVGGWQNAPTSAYFKGDLDDTSVYPTALTAAQVKALFNQGF